VLSADPAFRKGTATASEAAQAFPESIRFRDIGLVDGNDFPGCVNEISLGSEAGFKGGHISQPQLIQVKVLQADKMPVFSSMRLLTANKLQVAIIVVSDRNNRRPTDDMPAHNARLVGVEAVACKMDHRPLLAPQRTSGKESGPSVLEATP